MLILAYPWLLVLVPLPWLIRQMLPPRRVQPTALRVPFGDCLQTASAGGSTVHKAGDSSESVDTDGGDEPSNQEIQLILPELNG